LVYAGQLIAKGVDAEAACSMTMITPLTDDHQHLWQLTDQHKPINGWKYPRLSHAP
jgi:hypothetical protein